MGVTIENIIFDAGHLWLKRNYSITNHFASLDFWYVIAERLGFDFHTRSGQGQVSHMVKVKVKGYIWKSSLPKHSDTVKFNQRKGTCDCFPV